MNSINEERNSLETMNKDNYVEKCMLYFLSNDFNVKQIPYEDLVFT